MDSYKWRAHYNDGTIIDQFDENKKEISTSHLDANKVKTLELIPRKQNRNPFILHVNLEKGERFIRFWRRYTVDRGVGEVVDQSGVPTREWAVWVIGLQNTINKDTNNETNVKFFVYIYPDGSSHVTSDPQF